MDSVYQTAEYFQQAYRCLVTENGRVIAVITHSYNASCVLTPSTLIVHVGFNKIDCVSLLWALKAAVEIRFTTLENICLYGR